MLHALAFYMFATVLLASAVMVVAARNPVHAVLFLILCFFNAAGLFLLMGAEFVALILLIVYVGAVAVLFLFVVMMLNIDFRELKRGAAKYLPVGMAVGAVLVVELGAMALNWQFDPQALASNPITNGVDVENTRALGRVLYTNYFYPFQVSGLILLVAMIGAITLTLRHRPNVRRQRTQEQLDRKISDVIEMQKIESGKGVL
jgi:NADH-quinone oxidoreductase subunit J